MALAFLPKSLQLLAISQKKWLIPEQRRAASLSTLGSSRIQCNDWCTRLGSYYSRFSKSMRM